MFSILPWRGYFYEIVPIKNEFFKRRRKIHETNGTRNLQRFLLLFSRTFDADKTGDSTITKEIFQFVQMKEH